jgi:sulfide dehydrogenase cytochrome subunit
MDYFPSPLVGEGWDGGEEVERASSMRLLFVMLLITGLLPSGAAVADSAISSGHALVNACAACHGPDGRSQGAIPSIDNLSAEDFILVLKAFRADTRKGTVMNRISKGVDDAEITAMAAYFAGRRGVAPH